MIFSQWGTKIPLLLACTGILAWSSQAGASSSSCVQCHLDEDMLSDSLAEVKAKKSAMQSGAG